MFRQSSRFAYSRISMVRGALLLLLVTVAFGGEDNPLPAATQAKVDAFNARVERMKADFVKEYQKELDKTVSALERDQTAITKKGDLEGALAVKKIIDELNARIPETDILGNVVDIAAVGAAFKPGVYLFKSQYGFSENWTMSPDGAVLREIKSSYNGTYEVKDAVLTVTLAAGKYVFEIGEDASITGVKTEGGGIGEKATLTPATE